MIWEDIQGLTDQNLEVLNFYKRMVAIRHHLTLLKRGDFEVIPLDEKGGLFGFLRSIENEVIFIIFNRSPQEKIVHLKSPYLKDGELLVDYLDLKQVDFIESDDRNSHFYLKQKNSGYPIKNKAIQLKMQPWDSMILTHSKNLLMLSEDKSLLKNEDPLVPSKQKNEEPAAVPAEHFFRVS